MCRHLSKYNFVIEYYSILRSFESCYDKYLVTEVVPVLTEDSDVGVEAAVEERGNVLGEVSHHSQHHLPLPVLLHHDGLLLCLSPAGSL